MNEESRAPLETNPLIASARARTAKVVANLRKAISTMEQEIEQHEGLYPYNGGRITQAEVCRRAGISKITLQGAIHKTTTKQMVDQWVIRAASGVVAGKRNVRRAVTDRADAWKAAHKQIADQYHIAHLKLIDVERRVRDLENENAALRSELARSANQKVTALKLAPKPE